MTALDSFMLMIMDVIIFLRCRLGVGCLGVGYLGVFNRGRLGVGKKGI